MPRSHGRWRCFAAWMSASMMAGPGTWLGASWRWGGRSSCLTGLAGSRLRLPSQAQKLESVDCGVRIVPSARSAEAIASIQAWIVAAVRSVTRAGRASVGGRGIARTSPRPCRRGLVLPALTTEPNYNAALAAAKQAAGA